VRFLLVWRPALRPRSVLALRGLAARTWPGGSRRNAHSIPGVLFAAIGRGANVGFTIRERVEGAADGNRP